MPYKFITKKNANELGVNEAGLIRFLLNNDATFGSQTCIEHTNENICILVSSLPSFNLGQYGNVNELSRKVLLVEVSEKEPDNMGCKRTERLLINGIAIEGSRCVNANIVK